MKIGLVCPYHFGLPGGVQRQVLEWSKRLETLGHKSLILTCGPKVDLKRTSVVFFGNHLLVPTNDDIGMLSVYLKDGRVLKEYLEREKFDILHFHEPFAPFLSWQLLLASEVVNVATFHSFPEASGFLKTLGWPLKSLVLSHLVKGLKKFSAVSSAASSFVRDLAKEVEIIPNAIDLARFSASKKLKRFGDEKINLLYVGRLSKRKGFFYLLKSVRRVSQRISNFRLIVVGSGPEEEKARRFVKKNGLKNVVFEGRVLDDQLPSYYASADIFCAPATHGESFGVVLLEAMASGLPIVAFANAGYKEILKDKPFCDFLVKPREVKGFSWQLERLVTNQVLRERLGKAGLNKVQKYSWKRVGAKILKFYQEAIK